MEGSSNEMLTDTGFSTAPGRKTSLIFFSVTTPPVLEITLNICCVGLLCMHVSALCKLFPVLTGQESISVFKDRQ